jgi:iron complex outermembrane recepter protein
LFIFSGLFTGYGFCIFEPTMKKILPYILCLLFIIPLSLSAQKPNGTIRGQILTIGGDPAVAVSVELKKLGRIEVTDAGGNFKFRHLPILSDTLVISSVGTNFTKVLVDLKYGESLNMGTIQLTNKIAQLQNVEIMGRTTQSYKSDYSFFGNKTETPVKDIPQSISTITKELIHDKMEFTLKDAMDEVAGVSQYSGFDEYTIRGFRAENSRDINGLRGYNTTYTSSMLVNIERVEVIKGPTATLYGNCDPGGTINLVTKKPLQNTESELDIYGGTWDHFRAQGDITGSLNKSKTLLYRLNAGFDQSGSFINQQHSKSYEIAPSLTYIPNDKLQINFDFSVSHINTVLDWGQPGLENSTNLKATPISLSMSQPGDYLKETDIASIVTLSYKFNKHLSFNSGYLHYSTSQDVTNHGLQSYITPDSVDMYYTTWTYPTTTNTFSNYFTYKFKTGAASHEFILGYDFVKSTVNLNQQYYELPDQFGVGSGTVGTFSLTHPQYVLPPVSTYQPSSYDADGTDVDDNIYHTQGVYIQDQISLNKWKFLFSLREEFYKGDDVSDSASDLAETVFLPRVGVVYAVTPNISAYATYNKGFDAFEVSSSTQVFNAPFKPQISYVLEAGAKGVFLNNKLSATLSLYQLTLLNVAVSANDISNPNLYVQQGQNQSKGIEAEVVGNILPNLSVSLSYAYCVAKVTESLVKSQVGNPVENAPKNTSGSWIKYVVNRGTFKGLGIYAGHSGVGVRTTLDSTINLPSYFILNGGVNYHYKHFIIAANMNNITNEVYWMGAYNNVNKWPGAPRNFMINLGYKF